MTKETVKFKNDRAQPEFIRQDIITLLVGIETNDGKSRHITHNLIKDLNLRIYERCEAEHLKSMLSAQIPDHTDRQFEMLCDLAWYGRDYQVTLSYLNPGTAYASDFRGKISDRAFQTNGSSWIIGQYAMTAMKAERSKKEFSIGPTKYDWSRIVAAYLKNPHWSDDFARTGLSVSELLDKCDDEALLGFLGSYEALAERRSFEVVYKWEHQNNPERLWTDFTPASICSQFRKAKFISTTPENVDVLAVLKNGFVLTKSRAISFDKAA